MSNTVCEDFSTRGVGNKKFRQSIYVRKRT